VVKDVPEDSVVVGVPGHASSKTQPTHEHADLNHNRLPDTVELELQELYRRLEKVEGKLSEKNKTTV
jgi:hypothetical protein